MRKFTISVSTLTLSAAIASSLMFAGCKDKGSNKSSSEVSLVQKRSVSNELAGKALKAMALNESGSSDMSWDTRSGSGGNYAFSNVTFASTEGGGKQASIGKLELRGVRMENEHPIFDQIVFNNVSIDDARTKLALKKFMLNEPSPALAQAFAEAFSGNTDAFEDMDGDIGFSAISFSGFKMDNEQGHMALTLAEMSKAKDATGFFRLKDFDMDLTDNGETVKMKLGAIDVKGVNIDKYKGVFSAIKDENEDEALKTLITAMSPYDPNFKSYSFEGINIDAAGITFNLDSMIGRAEKKKDTVVMVGNMTPLTVMPSTGKPNRQTKEFIKALNTLGYEKLEFTMSQTSILNEKLDSMKSSDSYIALADGFKLSYDYDISGYKEYVRQAAEMGVKKNKNPMAALGMMSSLKFNKLRLALRDDTIVERAFKLAAEKQGGTPAALKNQAKLGLAFLPMMAQDEAQQKIAGDLSKSLGDWLEEGGTLVFDFAPTQPVDLGAIMMGSKSGEFDASTLGLKISRE